MQIGFIGLGIMGAPQVQNLLRAGYAVTVATRTPGKAAKFAADNKELGGGKNALFATRDGYDIGRIRDHCDDDIAGSSDFGSSVDRTNIAEFFVIGCKFFSFARRARCNCDRVTSAPSPTPAVRLKSLAP